MTPLPISRTQLDKLGDRLRDSDVPAELDLDLLESVLTSYDEVLQYVREALRDLGFEPTVRLKTTGTLIDKLRRSRGSSLKTVQDLAGARVVISGRLTDQDGAGESIVHAFRTAEHEPNIDDRRADPRAGYRAVHVIVKVDNLPVEIQIRTELQDLWAQIFERLGDTWGRAIRYGGQPDLDEGSGETNELRVEVLSLMSELSADIARHEERLLAFEVWPLDLHGHRVDELDSELRNLAQAGNEYVGALISSEQIIRELLNVIGSVIDQEGTAR